MDDKCLMEGLLLLEKGGCDLYMHGAIESSTDSVRRVFDGALKDSLSMQDSIYADMEQKGWYTTDNAERQKIDSVRTRYSSTVTA